ncbi:Alpha/Beta hydrolase protein [Mycena albidolilacea]|uniref:Alpha/Beta hydrolase protein n=1 Tax=Mycena albidolilacea TaxID=1033008 RepID=A0AAD7EMI8_9AGAR|nr:Alpha/Beta hydrolase protein [Mycena albidolilacea]
MESSSHVFSDPRKGSIEYIDCPPSSPTSKGIILLLHGFPQSSYQFRRVVQPLADAGYRIIVPDYSGGAASYAERGKKLEIAEALRDFLIGLEIIDQPLHIVGHDIGGMVADAFVLEYPELATSIIWGECPIPGTKEMEEQFGTVRQFHFQFHAVPDLPEALVGGREKLYLQHFFSKLIHKKDAIEEADLNHYAAFYQQPNVLRRAFRLYAAFTDDGRDMKERLRARGDKIDNVPCLLLNGKHSPHAHDTPDMASQLYKDLEVVEVPDAGHFIAEENPDAFVDIVLRFVEKHGGGFSM